MAQGILARIIAILVWTKSNSSTLVKVKVSVNDFSIKCFSFSISCNPIRYLIDKLIFINTGYFFKFRCIHEQTTEKGKKLSLKLRLTYVLAAFDIFLLISTPPSQASLGPNSAFMCKSVESVLPPSAAENAIWMK